jgi:hypothetical protein
VKLCALENWRRTVTEKLFSSLSCNFYLISGGGNAVTATTTLQGVIANGASTGSLVKSGDGTLLLSAANTCSRPRSTP